VRKALAALVVAWLVLTTFVVPTAAHAKSDRGAHKPAGFSFSGRVDIGGRELYLECRGRGSPTVVLVSGYPQTADVWSDDLTSPDSPRRMVLPGVSKLTRVCAYDRPGTVQPQPDGTTLPGRSDPVPQPRTAADAVAELHALLHTARLPGPYVLVGHSYGGLVVRLYAHTYPADVAGLVLVDPTNEELDRLLREQLTPEQYADFWRVLFEPLEGPPPPEYPDLELVDVQASFAQIRAAVATTPLSPMPLVVLTRGVPLSAEIPPGTFPPGFPLATIDSAWRASHEYLATLVPDGRLVIATRSGHNIHLDQPELVTKAIRHVVKQVRRWSRR
jgi:pimeloyl-ACP methyl ester carboxylesterase